MKKSNNRNAVKDAEKIKALEKRKNKNAKRIRQELTFELIKRA